MADGAFNDEETWIQNRYLLGTKLGQGCFGSVYRAVDYKNERSAVAIKVIDNSQRLSGKNEKLQILREVQTLQSLEGKVGALSRDMQAIKETLNLVVAHLPRDPHGRDLSA